MTKAELGGAIAVVEAAGRTVLYSTKQVVEAVAGSLNIVDARDESYNFFGFDLDDAVILTELINRSVGEDTLVVVSRKRLSLLVVNRFSCRILSHLNTAGQHTACGLCGEYFGKQWPSDIRPALAGAPEVNT